MPSRYTDLFAQIDDMNKELGGIDQSVLDENKLLSFKDDGSVTDEIKDEIDDIRSNGPMSACSKRFSAVNHLADEYASRWFKNCMILLFLNLIDGIQFSLFILLDKNILSGMLFLLTTALVMLANYHYAKTNYHHRFVKYRCLAESLRILYYRGLMGVRYRLSENYNDMVKSNLLPIVAVMKSWHGYFMNDVPEWSTVDKRRRVGAVKKCWLEERLAVNTETEYGDPSKKTMAQRYGNRKLFAMMNRILNTFSIVISITSILMVIYLIWCINTDYPFEPISFFESKLSFEIIIKSALIIMMAILTSITVLTVLLSTVRSNRNDAKIKTFSIAKRKLDRSSFFDEVVFSRMSKDDVDVLILKELGDLALKEELEWTNGQMNIGIKKNNTLDMHGLV